MKITVKHCGRTIELELDDGATMLHLQQVLHDICHVPVHKQRLVFTGGKKPKAADVVLKEALGGVAAAQCMLIGQAEVTAATNEAGHNSSIGGQNKPDESSHLVSKQKEANDGIYTCSYTQGYLQLDCFVCRTCIDNGIATEEHLICSSCADVCHAGHQVEVWGKRVHARCDCCTECFDSRHRCQFVVDEREPKVPAAIKMPKNALNRYPRDGKHFCYCRKKTATSTTEPMSPTLGSRAAPSFRSATTAQVDRASTTIRSLRGSTRTASTGGGRVKITSTMRISGSISDGDDDDWEDVDSNEDIDDDDEDRRCGGGAEDEAPVDDFAQCCILCNQCYWDSHLSRLLTKQMRHVPCYGQVVRGDVVAYNCRTCSSWVCPSCAVRCHKNHDIDLENPMVPTRDQNPNADFVFECGCLGMCAITEDVPPSVIVAEEEADGDEYMPKEVTFDLIDNDEFVNFICGQCMQENPWLVSERLNKCYEGKLPDLPANHKILPIWCAGQEPESAADPDPREGKTDADFYPYHGMLVPDGCFAEYTCQCDACVNMYEKLLPGCHEAHKQQPIDLYIATKEGCSNCNVNIGKGHICVTCELELSEGKAGCSTYLCDDCFARRDSFHPTHHEFAKDDFDTLWQVFGVSMVRHMDAELQQWMVENWNTNEAKEMFFDFLRTSSESKRLRDEDAQGSDDDRDADADTKRQHYTGDSKRKE